MGARICAFIEYDDMCLYDSNAPEAFTGPTDRVIDFTEYEALYAGKDYDFFAAISGIRNRFGIPPLFRPRGLPDGVKRQVREGILKFFSEDYSGIGWLRLEEIDAALSHMGIGRKNLSLAASVVLGCMQILTNAIGDSRVRLVFAVSD
jgi:hypothetical protein